MSRFRGAYVPDRKALHNAVRAEAGNRCIRCKHPEGDKLGTFEVINAEGGRIYSHQLMPCDDHCTHPRDGKLRILTVHHLTGQKDDNRWWNLLALCQSCHLTIQGKVIPEQAYLHPHSAWFVPYVCGFYAATIGRLEITRAEAEADPHRWLALGQPWLYEPGTVDPNP